MFMESVVAFQDSVSQEAKDSVEKVVKVITTINLVENYSENDGADEDSWSSKELTMHLLILLFLSLSGDTLKHVEILTWS